MAYYTCMPELRVEGEDFPLMSLNILLLKLLGFLLSDKEKLSNSPKNLETKGMTIPK